jgi:hypothetical protein
MPGWNGGRPDPAIPNRLHVTVADRAGWFVGADDDAEIGYGEVGQAHRRREDAVVEQAAAGPEHQRPGVSAGLTAAVPGSLPASPAGRRETVMAGRIRWPDAVVALGVAAVSALHASGRHAPAGRWQ